MCNFFPWSIKPALTKMTKTILERIGQVEQALTEVTTAESQQVQAAIAAQQATIDELKALIEELQNKDTDPEILAALDQLQTDAVARVDAIFIPTPPVEPEPE